MTRILGLGLAGIFAFTVITGIAALIAHDFVGAQGMARLWDRLAATGTPAVAAASAIPQPSGPVRRADNANPDKRPSLGATDSSGQDGAGSLGSIDTGGGLPPYRGGKEVIGSGGIPLPREAPGRTERNGDIRPDRQADGTGKAQTSARGNGDAGFRPSKELHFFERVPVKGTNLMIITGGAYADVAAVEANRPVSQWCYLTLEPKAGVAPHINLGSQSGTRAPVLTPPQVFDKAVLAKHRLDPGRLSRLARSHCRFDRLAPLG